MLHNMVRTELEQTHGYDPGHVHVDLGVLELNWKTRDEDSN